MHSMPFPTITMRLFLISKNDISETFKKSILTNSMPSLFIDQSARR